MIHVTATEFLLVAGIFAAQVILAWRTGKFWMRGNIAQSTSRAENPTRFQLIQIGLTVLGCVSVALGLAELLGLIGPDFKL
jgi:hypothetical protein